MRTPNLNSFVVTASLCNQMQHLLSADDLDFCYFSRLIEFIDMISRGGTEFINALRNSFPNEALYTNINRRANSKVFKEEDYVT